MDNISRFVYIKNKLKKNKLGKIIIKFYHYTIAIPLVWIYSLAFYFIEKKLKSVKFFDIETTFSILKSEKKSLCRFGDGEISWIYKDSKGYFGQENSEELSIRLKDVFKSNHDLVLIGIPDFFGGMDQYSKKRIRSRNAHLFKYHKRWMELIDVNYLYVDALITRVYNGRKINDVEYLFRKWKDVWKDKDIIIIEGSQTRFGVGNDLLDNANSVKRIIAPAENAFGKYNEIYESSYEYFKEGIIFLISLGPTATVLAHDIGINGIQAIDIGHLDIEYEWYLSNSTNKQPVPGKYVNEAGGAPNNEMPEAVLKQYKKEIIKYVV